MPTIISSDKLDKHSVNTYNFKVLSSVDSEDIADHEEPSDKLTKQSKITDVDSSALSSSSKESLIESLMQKTDEMSSNFIKLQMKLESKEEEYAKALISAKEQAFSEGIEAGIAQAAENSTQGSKQSIALFSDSVLKLEKSSKEFETALEGIKSGLIDAALDISKEVIKVELSQSSNEIATLLCDELLKELQSASAVKLEVNPRNHGAISEHIGNLEHITIISDSAVSEGGVIILSDAGNIDAQINKRFECVKRATLSE